MWQQHKDEQDKTLGHLTEQVKAVNVSLVEKEETNLVAVSTKTQEGSQMQIDQKFPTKVSKCFRKIRSKITMYGNKISLEE